MWGQVEKIGKGSKACFEADKKTITFAFNRGLDISGEQLRKQRERLMKELKELGFDSRMKYNGEVIVDNISEEDVVLEKKNGKLFIRIKKKDPNQKPKPSTDSDNNSL
jgi:hypothetical protein